MDSYYEEKTLIIVGIVDRAYFIMFKWDSGK